MAPQPAKKKPTLGAFNQGGEPPVILCINKSSIPFSQWKAGKSFTDLVAAMQAYANIFEKFWNLPAKVVPGTEMKPGCWAAVFTDNADVAGALGYHDTTPDGFPLMHNFVETTLSDGELPSVTASHELVEALGDPCINLCATGPHPTKPNQTVIYAYETADAVEAESFVVNGIPMSDFVLPSWFESFSRSRYDYLGKCSKPFQILTGGYMPVMINGKWTQIFGSEDARKSFNRKLNKDAKRRSVSRGRKLIASTAK